MQRVLTETVEGHTELTAFLEKCVNEKGCKVLYISEIPHHNKVSGEISMYPEYTTKYTVFHTKAE